MYPANLIYTCKAEDDLDATRRGTGDNRKHNVMNENKDDKLTGISKAGSVEEIAEFWNSHSLDDYWKVDILACPHFFFPNFIPL